MIPERVGSLRSTIGPDMTPELLPDSEPQPKGLGEGSRLTGVFFEPAKTFEDVAARPNFWVPLILVIVVALGYMVLYGQHVGWERTIRKQIDSSSQGAQLSPEQKEQRIAAGGDVSRLASVASFFVSRVDTETDRRLPEGSPLRGQAAVANAKLAYQMFLQKGAAPSGARTQRPLWASTSTKNPAYSPTLYVDTLIGNDTVNTLAQASVDVLAEGDADLYPDAILKDADKAEQVIADLPGAGVDFNDVTATLEREGVDAFSKSFHDALATLEKRATELRG